MEEKITPKRRRSSFIRGRLSSKSELSTSDICSNIPLSLSTEERFLKIIQHCYMKAAETVGKDIFPDDGKELQRFLMDANEGFENIEHILKEKGLCKLITKNSKTSRTMKNKVIEIYEEYMKRLSEESNSWEKIIEDEKVKLSDNEKSVSEQQPIVINLEDNSKSDYNTLIADFNCIREDLNVELESLSKINTLLNNVTEISEKKLIHQKNTLETILLGEIKDSPHRLIKKVIEKK